MVGVVSDKKKPSYTFGWGVGVWTACPFSGDHLCTEKWEQVCPFPTNRGRGANQCYLRR